MKTLADYYLYGIVVCCVIVVALYLVISIRLLLSARKEGINVCVSAMIPIYNLTLIPRKWWVKYKRKRPSKKKEEDVYAEDEEIEL